MISVVLKKKKVWIPQWLIQNTVIQCESVSIFAYMQWCLTREQKVVIKAVFTCFSINTSQHFQDVFFAWEP